MRFCLLNNTFPTEHVSKDAIFVASLANLLVAAGHSVDVVYCKDATQQAAKTAMPHAGVAEAQAAREGMWLDPKIRLHPLASPLGSLSPRLTQLTGKPVLKANQLREILEGNFDVVHWHNASLLGTPDNFRFSHARKVMTLHEHWLYCPSGLLFRNRKEPCEVRTCHRCTLAYGGLPQVWRQGGLVPLEKGDIDLFLAPNRSTAMLFQQYFPEMPVSLLPVFVAPQETLLLPRHDYFLYVGRLEPIKGLHRLIARILHTETTLRVVGDGSLAENLRMLAVPSPKVQFLGVVPRAELPMLYRQARATLEPSLAPDTLGLSALESLQQGTPVIAANLGALPEIVQSTGGGVVYRNETQLDEALRNPPAPGHFNLAEYSPEKHLRNYLSLLNAL